MVEDEIVDDGGAVGSGAMWHVSASKRHLGCWINGGALQGCEVVLHISIKNIGTQGQPHQLVHSVQSLHKTWQKICGGSVLDGSARDVLGWLGWFGSGWLRMSVWLGRLETARHGSANLQNTMGSKHSLVALYGVVGCVRQCFWPGETLKIWWGASPSTLSVTSGWVRAVTSTIKIKLTLDKASV